MVYCKTATCNFPSRVHFADERPTLEMEVTVPVPVSPIQRLEACERASLSGKTASGRSLQGPSPSPQPSPQLPPPQLVASVASEHFLARGSVERETIGSHRASFCSSGCRAAVNSRSLSQGPVGYSSATGFRLL